VKANNFMLCLIKQETDKYHAEMEKVKEALREIRREAYATKVELRR